MELEYHIGMLYELRVKLAKALPVDKDEDGMYGTDGSHEELMGVFERGFDRANDVAVKALDIIETLTLKKEHVAWCRYIRGDTTTIHLCNSDDEGAFRVYR